jgi:hypothetical protein
MSDPQPDPASLDPTAPGDDRRRFVNLRRYSNRIGHDALFALAAELSWKWPAD